MRNAEKTKNRMQMEHFSDKEVKHPVEVIAELGILS
jgi:hypothetical protein